jgi:hypothetical protein
MKYKPEDFIATNKESHVFNSMKGFRAGFRAKALVIASTTEMDWKFMMAYLLWGCDIWIYKVPMIKLMILVTVLNIIATRIWG